MSVESKTSWLDYLESTFAEPVFVAATVSDTWIFVNSIRERILPVTHSGIKTEGEASMNLAVIL